MNIFGDEYAAIFDGSRRLCPPTSTSCDVGYKYLIGFADLQSVPVRPLPRLAEATRSMYRSRKPTPTSSDKQHPGQRLKLKRLSSKWTMLSADRRQHYFARQKKRRHQNGAFL